jgi:hypothetical protein
LVTSLEKEKSITANNAKKNNNRMNNQNRIMIVLILSTRDRFKSYLMRGNITKASTTSIRFMELLGIVAQTRAVTLLMLTIAVNVLSAHKSVVELTIEPTTSNQC